MEAAAQAELPRVKAYLPVLDTIITLAPLLGLLGTITGMMSAFGMFKAICQGAQCKSLGFGYRFDGGCSVGENSGSSGISANQRPSSSRSYSVSYSDH